MSDAPSPEEIEHVRQIIKTQWRIIHGQIIEKLHDYGWGSAKIEAALEAGTHPDTRRAALLEARVERVRAELDDMPYFDGEFSIRAALDGEGGADGE